MSIPLIYFTTIGILFISYHIPKFLRITYYLLLVTIYGISFIYYSDLYLNHLTKVKPDHLLYGYDLAMEYAVNHQSNKILTFTDFYGQPYIYYLFFSKYDPKSYQKQANLIENGLDTGKISNIDDTIFATPQFQSLKEKSHQLMIFSYDDALRQGIDLALLTPLSPVNGHSTFYAYETP